LTGIGDSLDPDQLLIEFQPEEGHWSLLHDRRWFVTRDDHDLTVLRMMDGGDFLAQCNLAPLPTVTRDKLPTLDQFKQDVEKRLAEQSGTIIKASQRENKHGYRLFRVLATGEVGGSSRPPSKSGDAAKGDTNTSDEGRVKGLPVQWRYYLVADAQGHRAVLAFTLEDELAARVGDADERLVDGVRFATERPAEPSADRRSDRAQTLRPKAERSPR